MDADRWYAIASGFEDPSREAGIGHIVRAIQQAGSPEDSRRAFQVATQLGRNVSHPGLEAFLHGQSQTQNNRANALEALASIYYGTERIEEARELAHTLTTEFRATSHALRGWLTTYALALNDGDKTSAESALLEIEAGWPKYEALNVLRSELAAQQARSLERERSTSPSHVKPHSSHRVASSASDTASLPDRNELQPPYPNPAQTLVTVPLMLAQDAEVTLMLINVLGQHVQVLTSRSVQAGQHAFAVETNRLAPGVYLVQAAITTSSGTQRLQQMLTVVR